MSEGPVKQFDNSAQGITKLRTYLVKQATTLVVCEATGGYERLLVQRLQKAQLGVHVAHPSRVRALAKACGYEAKTNRQDAHVLSRFGQVFHQVDTPNHEPAREELQDRLRRRRQLVEHRVQERNRLDKGTSARVTKSSQRPIVWLNAEISRIEKAYLTVLTASSHMSQQAARY